MTAIDLDRENTLHHIDEALDSLLVLRLAIGGLPDAVPHHSFDRALNGEEYQEARERAHKAWEPIIEKADNHQAAMRAEEAVNALAVKAAEIGWRLAMVSGAERLG